MMLENLGKYTILKKDGSDHIVVNHSDLPITEDITLTATWTKRPEISKYYTVIFVTGDQKERTTVKENEQVRRNVA